MCINQSDKPFLKANCKGATEVQFFFNFKLLFISGKIPDFIVNMETTMALKRPSWMKPVFLVWGTKLHLKVQQFRLFAVVVYTSYCWFKSTVFTHLIKILSEKIKLYLLSLLRTFHLFLWFSFSIVSWWFVVSYELWNAKWFVGRSGLKCRPLDEP